MTISVLWFLITSHAACHVVWQKESFPNLLSLSWSWFVATRWKMHVPSRQSKKQTSVQCQQDCNIITMFNQSFNLHWDILLAHPWINSILTEHFSLSVPGHLHGTLGKISHITQTCQVIYKQLSWIYYPVRSIQHLVLARLAIKCCDKGDKFVFQQQYFCLKL